MPGLTVEYILLECARCSAKIKKYPSHRLTDEQIMPHLPGWTAIGVNGAVHTLCPDCNEEKR